jgi:hypothetical protein
LTNAISIRFGLLSTNMGCQALDLSLEKFLQVKVSESQVVDFRNKAREKIKTEGWAGRDAELKALNFVKAWTSEYSWGTLLEERGIRYLWAGTYVGPAAGAPLDFTMWFDGLPKTVGLRSRDLADLTRYGEVPYPDDRVRTNQVERIEDYTVAASLIFKAGGSAEARLYGAIEKVRFISILNETYVKGSRGQQELFRPVALKHFDFDLLVHLLDKADRKSA